MKTNENLGQVRLRLNQTSKKAPTPLRNPGYATAGDPGPLSSILPTILNL